MEEIRALSWKQPFAELMLHGKIETRIWDTKYRGLVLICASKKGYGFHEIQTISGGDQSIRITCVLGRNNDHFLQHYRSGIAIAVGRLVDSRPMTKEDEDKCFVQYHKPWLQETKRKYKPSKFTTKRLWCHIYEDVREIEPFEWQGTQGWKVLDQDIIDKIKFKK